MSHVAISLSLLTIVAGMFLLAKTNAESLGKFFRYISYFIVIMGFLNIICIGVCGIMRCSRGGNCMKSGNWKEQCNEVQNQYMGGHMGCRSRMNEGCGQEEMMMGQCHKGMKKRCCSMHQEKHFDEEETEDEDSAPDADMSEEKTK